MIFLSVPTPFAFSRAAQARWGRAVAFAEAGAVATTSFAKGGDGVEEETGVGQGSGTAAAQPLVFSGELHVIQLCACGLVSWPSSKIHICYFGR